MELTETQYGNWTSFMVKELPINAEYQLQKDQNPVVLNIAQPPPPLAVTQEKKLMSNHFAESIFGRNLMLQCTIIAQS